MGRRRRVVFLAVLMGHVALLLLLWQGRRSTAASAEARQVFVLRLVPPVRPPRPQPTQAQLSRPAASPVNIRLITPPDFVVAPGAVFSPDREAATAGVHAAVAAQAASGGEALNLRPRIDVLRGALANPATTDPRSNSPRPTFEERIAMGLDPDLCVKLERDAQGVVTRRMGRMARVLSHLQATQGAGAKDVRTCQ
jgi:hypothetical protein